MQKTCFRNKDLETRKRIHESILESNPGKIQIVILDPVQKNSPVLPKKKYLVSPLMTVNDFTKCLKSKMILHSNQTIFLTCGQEIITGSKTISEIYNNHKDEDGFLYISYRTEDTFG